jgi:hypothetical protein
MFVTAITRQEGRGKRVALTPVPSVSSSAVNSCEISADQLRPDKRPAGSRAILHSGVLLSEAYRRPTRS